MVLAARSEDKLAGLAEELGEDALAVRCDVTSWEDQQALVATALDRFGRLDVFFANAGFGAKRGFLEEIGRALEAMIDTNVYGAALSIRAALGHFREQNRGHMLLTELRRGPAGAARVALLGHQVGRLAPWARRSARSWPTPTSRSR